MQQNFGTRLGNQNEQPTIEDNTDIFLNHKKLPPPKSLGNIPRTGPTSQTMNSGSGAILSQN